MGDVLVITSGKGGVGKSTVAVGLAVSFCQNSKKVLLIDADEGLRCLDGLLGAEKSVLYDAADIQSEPESVETSVIKTNYKGLYLLAAPAEFGMLDSEKFGNLVSAAREYYDYVIVDCPAGVEERYYISLPRDSKVLVVTNSDESAVNGAEKAGLLVKKLGFTNVRLIVNKFSNKRVGKIHRNIDEIVNKTAIGLIGIIPFDDEIVESAAKSKAARNGRAVMAFSRIAARINGVRVLLPKVSKI